MEKIKILLMVPVLIAGLAINSAALANQSCEIFNHSHGWDVEIMTFYSDNSFYYATAEQVKTSINNTTIEIIHMAEGTRLGFLGKCNVDYPNISSTRERNTGHRCDGTIDESEVAMIWSNEDCLNNVCAKLVTMETKIN